MNKNDTIMEIFCNICKSKMGEHIIDTERYYSYIGEWIKEFNHCFDCVKKRGLGNE